MGVLKETFKQYKWVLLAGVIVAVLVTLITANLHVLRFINYKIQNNTEGIISILQAQSKNEAEMNNWFFTQGIDYLVNQEEYTEEMTGFFEENFEFFPFETQKQIVKAYNSKNLSLSMNAGLMDVLVNHLDDDVIKAYIKRLEPDQLEQGLTFIYGSNPEVNEDLVNGLYELLNVYPQKLNFNKFQFNLYDLLNYSGENAEEQKKSIVAKVPSETAREHIFKELNNRSVTEEEINSLVKFFNDTNLITNNEYTAFNNAYSEICLIRKQYQALDTQQIELQNKKDQVDVQISDSSKALEIKQSEISAKQGQISELETQIDSITNYIPMTLYVEGSSGSGSNEYIASVPRNSLFSQNGFRPTNQKYIVKLQESTANDTVIYINVFLKGTKAASNGKEYTYYTEVSDSDLASISQLENERNSMLAALSTLKEEAASLENTISKIKADNNYEETQEALKNIVSKRDELSKKLSEKTISIKELFGLKDLRISLEA